MSCSPQRKSARAAATNRRNYLEVEQALDADTGADGDQDGDADVRDHDARQRQKRRRLMPTQQDHGRTGEGWLHVPSAMMEETAGLTRVG